MIQVGDRVLIIGYVVLLDDSAEKMTGHGVFSFFIIIARHWCLFLMFVLFYLGKCGDNLIPC